MRIITEIAHNYASLFRMSGRVRAAEKESEYESKRGDSRFERTLLPVKPLSDEVGSASSAAS